MAVDKSNNRPLDRESNTTRRDVLKKIGGASIGIVGVESLIGSGIASASGGYSSSQKKLRLRRSMSDPLSLPYVHERKREIIQNSSLYEDNEVVPDIRVEGSSQNEKILAYNFDIIDGAPTEWTYTR